jgi:hypothetical protein
MYYKIQILLSIVCNFKGLVPSCRSFSLLYMFSTCIHSTTFIQHNIHPSLFDISSSPVSSVSSTSLGRRAVNWTRTWRRTTIWATPHPNWTTPHSTEPRRTLTDLRRTLLSYAAPYWAIPHPTELCAPYWATPHSTEPRRTLLSYASPWLSYAAPYWAMPHPTELHSTTLLSYAAPYVTLFLRAVRSRHRSNVLVRYTVSIIYTLYIYINKCIPVTYFP